MDDLKTTLKNIMADFYAENNVDIRKVFNLHMEIMSLLDNAYILGMNMYEELMNKAYEVGKKLEEDGLL